MRRKRKGLKGGELFSVSIWRRNISMMLVSGLAIQKWDRGA